MDYFCEKCNYKAVRKQEWYRHLDSNRHIITCCKEEDIEEEKKIFTFKCVPCKKDFDSKQNYQRHMTTKKHRIMFDENQLVRELEKKLENRKLDVEEKKIDLEYRKLEFEEKKLTILASGTTINNINNVQNINTLNVDRSVKNNFNLNIFLNEDCKDALNITDFINNISLTLADLEETARLGYTEGITKIIVDRIKEIGINRRPYHCTDLKREIVYIKDEDLWEKEQNDKPRMKKMISNIIHKNLEQLTDWKDSHPGCMDLTNPNGEAYLNMMIEANGGSDRDRKENKILKNILEDANITA